MLLLKINATINLGFTVYPRCTAKACWCTSSLLRLLPYVRHSTEIKGVLGEAQYLWEQGRNNLARDSWNFSAEIHQLGKKISQSSRQSHFHLLPQQHVTSKTADMSRKKKRLLVFNKKQKKKKPTDEWLCVFIYLFCYICNCKMCI